MATEEQVTSRVIRNIFGDVFDDKKIAEMTEREVRNQESKNARINTTNSSNPNVGPKQPPKNPATGGSKGSPKIPPKVSTEGKYTTGTGDNRRLKTQSSPLRQGYNRAINSGKGLLGTIGRIPGARGALGLLGTAARFGTPLGLAGTAAYYGARGLGYDPFGFNTEEPKAPTPIGYDVNRDTPKAPPGARWQQTFRPDSSATGKELINAALFRAAMQGNMADAGQAAASVLVDKGKYRTGAEALAAGMENLGDQAQVSVSQDKDGFYQYYGKVDNSLNLLKGVAGLKTVNQEEYNQLLELAKSKLPNETEENLIIALNKKYEIGE